MKNLLKFVSFLSLIMVSPPMVVFAANTSCDGITGLGNLLCRLSGYLNAIIPVLIGLGMVYFIWGVVQYVIAGGEEAKKKGRDQVIYGIIGLAVIVSIWGLVNLVTGALHLNGTAQDVSSLVTTPTNSDCTAISGTSNLAGVLNYFTCLIGKSVIPFIFALAMLSFTWGAVKFFIIDADEEAKRAQGKQFMIWGIIALAVMLSVWGLVTILDNTFGVNTHFLPEVKPS